MSDHTTPGTPGAPGAPGPEDDPIIESPSGWSFRESQENGDEVDCASCGDPLDDDYPISNDEQGFAYHPACLAADRAEQ